MTKPIDQKAMVTPIQGRNPGEAWVAPMTRELSHQPAHLILIPWIPTLAPDHEGDRLVAPTGFQHCLDDLAFDQRNVVTPFSRRYTVVG